MWPGYSNGRIAQSVERWSNKPLVMGSSPIVTIFASCTLPGALLCMSFWTTKNTQSTNLPHISAAIYLCKKAPRVRLELTTYRLTAGRAADCAIQDFIAGTSLPGKKEYSGRGLNSRPSACKADVITTRLPEHRCAMVLAGKGNPTGTRIFF